MAWNRYSLDLELSSSQYSYVADNAALSITGDLTMEGWIKLEQLPSASSTMLIAGKTNPGSSLVSYSLFISSTDDKLYLAYSDDGTTANRNQISMDTAFTSADVGKWVHIAAAVDVSAKSVNFYKNGSLISDTLSTDGGSTSIHDNASDFSVGARKSTATWGLFYDGLISNLRIFSDIRSQAEIQAGMYAIYTGTTNNLVGSWYNDANDHNDDAGSNNLTAVNSPVFSTNVPFNSDLDSEWSSTTISVDNTKVSGSGDLTDFPALIKDGNLPSAVYSGLSDAGGADLRFSTDSTGDTEIPFEIVSITPGSELCEIWLKIPTLQYDADTDIYVWYGNANAVAYDANAPFGSQTVWSDYSGVWHLEEASGTRADSTANANTLSDNNTVTSSTGKIGTATQHTASNTEYLSKADNASLSTGDIDFALTGWFYVDSLGADRTIFAKTDNSTVDEYQLIYLTSTTQLRWGVNNQRVNLSTLGTPSTGTWYYFYCYFDSVANTVNASINGGTVDSAAGTTGTDTAFAFNIGANNGSLPWDGRVDEVKFIKNNKLSLDWATTEYNNQNDPSTFWTAAAATTRRYFAPGIWRAV